MSIATQLQTVAFMCACGALMGTGYDTYQVFRGKISIPRWLIFLCDLAFWIASAGMVFIILVKVNDGIVRFPVYLGVIVGAWLYFVVGSKYYIQFLLAVIRFSQWLYRLIVRILDIFLVKPIQFFYRLIVMIIGFILTIIVTILRIVWKIIHFLLYPFIVIWQKMAKRLHVPFQKYWLLLKQWIHKPKKPE